MPWSPVSNIKGATGATGGQGIQGPKGDKGDTGSVGPPGSVGSIPDGTLAAPGLAFGSDLNVGLYRPATDTLGLSAGGVAALTLNTSGLLIGGSATFSTDNLYDIGAVGARPRDLILGRNLTVGGTVTVPSGSIAGAAIASGGITPTQLAVGAAAINVGTLGGVLGGTLPNPTMSAGAAATNVGALGGVLGGTLPNPTMAAGAAAANVGTLGGTLTGTLPNPALAANAVGTAQLANNAVTNAKLASDTARANLLTNGGFENWQRGNGPFNTIVYGPDRWRIEINSGSLSVSRDTANVDVGSQASAAYANTFSGTLNRLASTLNDVAPQLAGRVVSVSARVRANAANALRMNVYSDTSNGGGTNAVQATSATDAGNSAWNTLSVTLTLPAGANYLTVRFEFVATVSGNVDNVMLVVGNIVADYAPLHPADDLARCLRYYEKIGPPSGSNFPVLQAYAAGGQPFSQTLTFASKKAVVPSLTVGGTFAYSNASGVFASHADVNGCVYGATATGLGGCSVFSNTSGYISAEANP